MLKASAKGGKLVILGITGSNFAKMLQGDPVRVDLAFIEAEGAVWLLGGRDTAELSDQFDALSAQILSIDPPKAIRPVGGKPELLIGLTTAQFKEMRHGRLIMRVEASPMLPGTDVLIFGGRSSLDMGNTLGSLIGDQTRVDVTDFDGLPVTE